MYKSSDVLTVLIRCLRVGRATYKFSGILTVLIMWCTHSLDKVSEGWDERCTSLALYNLAVELTVLIRSFECGGASDVQV